MWIGRLTWSYVDTLGPYPTTIRRQAGTSAVTTDQVYIGVGLTLGLAAPNISASDFACSGHGKPSQLEHFTQMLRSR